MEGKNIRYVVSYINKDGMRRILGACYGSNTQATRKEAEVARNFAATMLEEVWRE